jgi:AbrB family looped-hinge helix DNA binding protein
MSPFLGPVIPKEIRREVGLKAGMPLDVKLEKGRIEITPAPMPVELQRKGRLLVAVPGKRFIPSLPRRWSVHERRCNESDSKTNRHFSTRKHLNSPIGRLHRINGAGELNDHIKEGRLDTRLIKTKSRFYPFRLDGEGFAFVLARHKSYLRSYSDLRVMRESNTSGNTL